MKKKYYMVLAVLILGLSMATAFGATKLEGKYFLVSDRSEKDLAFTFFGIPHECEIYFEFIDDWRCRYCVKSGDEVSVAAELAFELDGKMLSLIDGGDVVEEGLIDENKIILGRGKQVFEKK